MLRVLAKQRDPSRVTLGEVATTKLVTVAPDANITQARDLMAEHRIRRLPVVKGDRLVGILSLGDVAVADASKRAVGAVLDRISQSPSTTDKGDGPVRGMPDRVRRSEASTPKAS